MIRREATSSDGQPVWLLIPQTQHALLAGMLASRWAAFPGLSSVAREQLLIGVYLHDAGWNDWDDAPEIDLELGRPYQFTEMPGVSMLPIWRNSISTCEAQAPLAGYAASGHFCELLERHLAKLTSRREIHEAKQFLERESARRERCKWLWAQHGEIAELELAVRYLQAFDFISLWLCCTRSQTCLELSVPHDGERHFRFIPTLSDPMRSWIDPWPLSAATFEASLIARQVAAACYQCREAFLGAPSEKVPLTWRMGRLSGNRAGVTD